MPDIIFALLGAMARLSYSAKLIDIVDVAGYEESGQFYFGFMRRAGFIERHLGFWQMTEQGKIAFAIETGRRTKVRGKRHYQPMTDATFRKLYGFKKDIGR